MPKRGTTPNTRSGGQPTQMSFRGIVADPNGNREQRRAAKRLAGGQHQTGAFVIEAAPEEGETR
jgi:hypothetical protein